MILAVILGCLFPLAVYCMILAALNRRLHPVMVPGSWDLAGMLCGASGFLLVAGPFILTTLNQRWRDFWLYNGSALDSLSERSWYLRLGLWIGYFGLIVAGAVVLLWRRRRVTSIYNVEPDAFQEVLARVLDRSRLEWLRAGNRIAIRAGGVSSHPREEEVVESAQAPRMTAVVAGSTTAADLATDPMDQAAPAEPAGAAWKERKLVLELDLFAAMRHVTLTWPADAGALRQEIESALARSLAEMRTANNPVGSWFLSISGSLFAVMFLTLLFLVVVYILIRLKGGF